MASISPIQGTWSYRDIGIYEYGQNFYGFIINTTAYYAYERFIQLAYHISTFVLWRYEKLKRVVIQQKHQQQS